MEGKMIYQKIADVMRDLSAVGKERTNSQQGWKFRGIDDVYNALHPLMAKHGVFTNVRIIKAIHREKMISAKGTEGYHQILEIEYTFYCEDSSAVSTLVWGEASDWSDKVSNKCLSIAHKYALIQVFCIPTVDLDDPDVDVNVAMAKPGAAANAQPAPPSESREGKILSAFGKYKIGQKYLEEYMKKPLGKFDDKDANWLFDIYKKLESGVAIGEAFLNRAEAKMREF